MLSHLARNYLLLNLTWQTHTAILLVDFVLAAVVVFLLAKWINNLLANPEMKVVHLLEANSQLDLETTEATTDKLESLGAIDAIAPKDYFRKSDDNSRFLKNQCALVRKDAAKGYYTNYPRYKVLDDRKVVVTFDQRVQLHVIRKYKPNIIDAIVRDLELPIFRDAEPLDITFSRYDTDFRVSIEVPEDIPMLQLDYVQNNWDDFVHNFSQYSDLPTYAVPVGIPVDRKVKLHPSRAPHNNIVLWPTTQAPTLLINGLSRKGKSAWTRSFIATTKLTHPETEFIFIDGKLQGKDFSDFSKYFGLYEEPALRDTNAENELINFDNAIFLANELYVKRAFIIDDFSKTTGISCSTFATYNAKRVQIIESIKLTGVEKGNSDEQTNAEIEQFEARFPYIPMLFVVIDEVPQITAVSVPSASEAPRREGDSSWKIISALMKAAGSAGVRMIFITQENKEPALPAWVRKGITATIYFGFPNESVLSDHKGVMPGNLENGRFYFCFDNLVDEITKLPPVLALPFSGDLPDFFDKIPAYSGKRYKYDPNLISSVPDKLTEYAAARLTRALWCLREEMNPGPLTNDGYWHFEFNHAGQKRRLVVAKKKELTTIGYEDMARFFPDRVREQALLLILEASGELDEKKLSESARENGYIPLFESLASKYLNKAFESLNKGETKAEFGPFLDTYMKKTEVTTAEDSITEELEINKKTLDMIVNLKASNDELKVKKGDLFENFVHEVYSQKYYVYKIKDVLASEAYRHFDIKHGDLGGDLLWSLSPIEFSSETVNGKILPVVTSASEITLAQLKNWDSPIDQHVLSRTLGAMRNFRAQKGAIVLAKGGVKNNRNFKAELALSGIEIHDYDFIVSQLPGEERPKSRDEVILELAKQGAKYEEIVEVIKSQFNQGSVALVAKVLKKAGISKSSLKQGV